MRQEWESLKKHDIIFLLTVRPKLEYGTRFDPKGIVISAITGLLSSVHHSCTYENIWLIFDSIKKKTTNFTMRYVWTRFRPIPILKSADYWLKFPFLTERVKNSKIWPFHPIRHGRFALGYLYQILWFWPLSYSKSTFSVFRSIKASDRVKNQASRLC